jgi:hypothetical protein
MMIETAINLCKTAAINKKTNIKTNIMKKKISLNLKTSMKMVVNLPTEVIINSKVTISIIRLRNMIMKGRITIVNNQKIIKKLVIIMKIEVNIMMDKGILI